MEPANALALLEWQIELGVTEAIGDAPVNRYEVPAEAPKVKTSAAKRSKPAPGPVDAIDPVAMAQAAAAEADSLETLAFALGAFEHCELKRGARNLVFSDGMPEARVMIIGEAPGRDEDLQGRPFVGAAGQLLDKMFGAIGMARDAAKPEAAIYITNILPWRPPQNRDPLPEEIDMMLPFVRRHIQLAAPDLLVLMGNIACQALLGRKGITRLRGSWETVMDRPTLPIFHPAYLLRNPAAKREAWADLLALQARLREMS
ncbi:MAG: uracil-DNA glycosylase [Alphaproteobacteria bacterium]|nr:uracil-DNA glycosylase [Alphaproteobacteria bacterium]NNF23844.1 uracil-DNA glycosylase [Paracoccaceae bacterium]